MADGSKIPFLPSISPNPRPQQDIGYLRQTIDTMLKQIHANHEAIRSRDDEVVSLRMELASVKKTMNDKMFRMSNNIKGLKQQLNDLRQRESVISGLENELKNCTSKQEELITFQENQDSKLSEMECSIIESCHQAIADIRTKQLKESEETSQNQVQSLTKITAVQGILKSNVRSVQMLLEKKTQEDNRRFQKQENLMDTLQPKIDQVLSLENSINKMASWRKSKTESDKKLFEQLNNKILNLQAAMSSNQHTDGLEIKMDDLVLSRENKTKDSLDTIQARFDEELHSLKSRIKHTEASIFGISKWQRDRLENDKMLKEIGDTSLEELKQRVDNLENKAISEKTDIPDNIEKPILYGSDHARTIARMKRRIDGHEELLEILEEKMALTTTNVFQVSLNATQALQTGQRSKLDKCVKVWFDNNSLFDKENCCLVPRNNCKMALAWRLCQFGEGELEAWMGVDGVGEGDYLGRTTKQNEVMSGVLMWGVRKGQRIWMEVERGQGEAGLWSCLFMAWVVG